jgi:hypothetical protein
MVVEEVQKPQKVVDIFGLFSFEQAGNLNEDAEQFVKSCAFLVSGRENGSRGKAIAKIRFGCTTLLQ